MQTGPDATRLILDAEALLAQAKRSLEGSEGFFAGKAGMAREMLAQIKRQREEELRSSVAQQFMQAQIRPVLPAPEIATDTATQLARQVRRRRSVV